MAVDHKIEGNKRVKEDKDYHMFFLLMIIRLHQAFIKPANSQFT